MSASKAFKITSITSWRRPILWTTAIIAILAYWDERALNGVFIYDDVASITNNDVVMLKVPWYEAFTRDFWGQHMVHPASHKSYRPITTLTLTWNMILSYVIGTAGAPDHTYYFHVVNVVLHGINTGLIAEAAAIVLGDGSLAPSIIAGVLFGIHPVHAEAVSNITSRGELLMTLFFLLAFLFYVNHIPRPPTTQTATISKDKDDNNAKEKSPNKTSKKSNKAIKAVQAEPAKSTWDKVNAAWNFVCVYVLPFLFMALSLFSKEQGVTTLCSLVAFDFIRNHDSVQSFLSNMREGEAYSWNFVKRTVVLALQTISMAALRYWLNGESSPDFVHEQNPPGFSEDRFTRIFSVNWVYVLYLRDMVFPAYLAPDWSGLGIPLIESMSDNRAWLVILLWAISLGSVYSLLVGSSPKASKQSKEIRQVGLIAFYAFLFLPFLLSSNLLVTTGLCKADRVIYLPLFGYCLIQGLIFKLLSSAFRPKDDGEESVGLMVLYTFFAIQFSFFGLKVHERNLAWADEYTLWTRAAQVNPRSLHTLSNAGKVLAKNDEYVEAERLLRPCGDVRTNNGNPNDTFLYTVALAKLDRCEESFRLIDDAIEFIHEEREKGGIRYDAKMSFHAQSSLIVSRAFCTEDIFEKGRIMQQALTIDPNNDFAQHQYKNYLETLHRMHQQMQMGNPQLEQQISMARQEMQRRGMSEEAITMAIQEKLNDQQKLMEQMQEQQQRGKPQGQAEMLAMQQEMMRRSKERQEQKPKQQQRQREKKPQPRHTQGKDIPQNLGTPTQAEKMPPNLAMPPIEEFDNGELDGMFFKEEPLEVKEEQVKEEPVKKPRPRTSHGFKVPQQKKPNEPKKAQKEMPKEGKATKVPKETAKDRETPAPKEPQVHAPPDIINPATLTRAYDKRYEYNLGLPPIEEFENGGFERMFLKK
ncbi:and TPR repeat-containing protein 2 [Seminavis robusta]|uniref:And TPR repeat-containing protein 2 n=1 Tax=Seminavis robusta TaxID=568900 RepID=A0A9N8DJP7_9STRA|nr:and TPR repeat-containing protein 2 [Seminavis robusta]|eukprot:Sro190_g081900.1 and TPR repeat-containing protein 2 (923) ;mRNA; r:61607-64375